MVKIVTIRDVAKRANVSVATVSRVINESARVNPTTRKKVEKAIKELNYRPNEIARSFFTGKSKMLALLVPDITNPFFPELARSIEDSANKRGYTLLLCNTDNNQKKEQHYLSILQQKRVDGIINISNTKIDTKDYNIPLVFLDRGNEDFSPSVTVNNREGSKEAIVYLKSKKRNRIAHISGPKDDYNAQQRLKGYLDIVKDESWFSDTYIRYGNYDFQTAYNCTIDLLKDKNDVDSIFVGNDFMAIGVLKAIEQSGKRVPEDISVIGFDGIKLGEQLNPSLTTMAQPLYEIGQKATETLIDMIQNNKTDNNDVIEFKVKLKKRDSA